MRIARSLVLLFVITVAGCAGSTAAPPYQPPAPVALGGQAYDRLAGTASCEVSADGAIWYRLSAGTFAPLDIGQTRCTGAQLDFVTPPQPSWARPSGATQAVFAASSLLGTPGSSVGAVNAVAGVASGAGVPLTWLVDRAPDAATAAALDARHRAGDDVEVAPSLTATARATWPWFVPRVAVLGAGAERDIAGARAAGDTAFWGLTWNSLGVDRTSDRGAPWGVFCADPSSYKRPQQDGGCAFTSIEWTARDLTAAFWTFREDAWSTDPDDIRLRGGLQGADAVAYMQELADAYAAAGQSAPLVMVSQQEAAEEAAAPDDAPILDALYRRALADGMRAVTFPQAATLSRNAPRAIAFPLLPQTRVRASGTIDALDTRAGFTFVAGETTPARVFDYTAASTSRVDAPVPQRPAVQLPVLLGASAQSGTLTLRYRAPVAQRYAAAFWSDPTLMGWTSPNIVPAGRAGAVAFFDLSAGDNTITVGCTACTSTTFTYAAGT